MAAPFKSRGEPVVGDPYERAIATMIFLAERIEKVKIAHETFKKLESGKQLTPKERNERLAVIRTSINWLSKQARKFAENRGNEEGLAESLNGIGRAAAKIRGQGREAAARDFWIIETTSEIERWLEENRLLLNVSEPEKDYTEEAWSQIVKEAVGNYLREHPRSRHRRDPLAEFDKGLDELDQEKEDGDVDPGAGNN